MTLTDDELKKLTSTARALGERDGYAAGYAAGLAAIPREPSKPMIAAGEKKRIEIAGRGICIGVIWRAMWDAAQEKP